MTANESSNNPQSSGKKYTIANSSMPVSVLYIFSIYFIDNCCIKVVPLSMSTSACEWIQGSSITSKQWCLINYNSTLAGHTVAMATEEKSTKIKMQ